MGSGRCLSWAAMWCASWGCTTPAGATEPYTLISGSSGACQRAAPLAQCAHSVFTSSMRCTLHSLQIMVSAVKDLVVRQKQLVPRHGGCHAQGGAHLLFENRGSPPVGRLHSEPHTLRGRSEPVGSGTGVTAQLRNAFRLMTTALAASFKRRHLRNSRCCISIYCPCRFCGATARTATTAARCSWALTAPPLHSQ